MRARAPSALALVPGLALVQVAVGVVARPEGPGTGMAAVLRLALALACSLSLVLGPGLAAWALAAGRGRRFPLAFVGLPGPALLALTGGLAWWGATVGVTPRRTATVLLTPVLLGLVLVAARRRAPEAEAGPWLRRAVIVAVVVLVVSLAKATWSPGPEGELYGGTVSRTLEVGGRSDSRISFHVVQLVAYGTGPYSARGAGYFAPYSFSYRGPVAGLAAAPVVLLSGARVPVDMPDQPWSPFDPQGFGVYRLTMSTMAVTAFLALFALVSRLAGFRAGYQAALLGALTPFLLHETYFTWPKLQAAGLVLVAAYLVVERHPAWAGLAAGAGYLVHPGALLSVPALALVWLLAARSDVPRREGPARAALGLVWMGAGTLVCLGLWRLANGDHFQQLNFVRDNLLQADTRPVHRLGPWLSGRASSVLNTLVPLHLFLRDAHRPAVNSIYGPSPAVVHFYFQYWTGLPFGIGIVALPAVAAWLARAARLMPAVFLAAVVVPFGVFAVFWGGDATGMLREGMHVWVLSVVLVVAWARARSGPLPAGVARWEAASFALRAPEALLVLVLPAAVTSRALSHHQYLVTDVVSLAVMAAGLAWLGRESFVWLGPADRGAGSSEQRRRNGRHVVR
jgi:hypothetical protein